MTTDTINCIKKSENWTSSLSCKQKFDNTQFDPSAILNTIDIFGPKLKALIETIKSLDKCDIDSDGHTYKHFIYTDLKSVYGAKLIASALVAYGFKHAYKVQKSKFKISEEGSDVFAILSSSILYGKPIGVRFQRELLKVFNSRPDNIFGDKCRIMVLDSGFREGVDLFDVKYVHLFEPLLSSSQEKQAIGRATRFCGQKGLSFNPDSGWPLHTYKYNTLIPKRVQTDLPFSAQTYNDVYLNLLKANNKNILLGEEFESIVPSIAIDKQLTKEIHSDKSKATTLLQTQIGREFKSCKWGKQIKENMCSDDVNDMSDKDIVFSPTQDFVRCYFTPSIKQKGLLLVHSVGTGKTCTAIATASSSFEQCGYTILYVTRHTLKSDMWKNMFERTCNILLRGLDIPDKESKRKELIKCWMKPISYKQFSNMLAGKNAALKAEMVKRNGKTDLLKRTLVIIDEAHKLFDKTVKSSEKPNTEIISSSFLNSYETSGKESVKVLLMTATPFSEDALDLIDLVNLLKSKDEQMSTSDFHKEYLGDDTGRLTQNGKTKVYSFLNGYISYLNRAKDISTFAQPVLHNIDVEISENEVIKEMDEFVEKSRNIKFLQSDISMFEEYIQSNKDNLSLLEEDYRRCKEKKLDNCHIYEKKKKMLTKNIQDIESNVEFDKQILKNDIDTMGFHLDKKNINKNTHEATLKKCLDIKVVKNKGDIDTNDSPSPMSNISKDVYMIVGHGYERYRSFNKRDVVPEGVYLVTLAHVGRPVWVSVICKLMQIINNKKYEKMTKNPLKYKRDIEDHINNAIRIYTPGDYMPDIHTSLFLDFPDAGQYIKSGVYKQNQIPNLNRSVMKANPIDGKAFGKACPPFTGYTTNMTPKEHDELYRGTIYSKRPILNKHNSFPIDDVIKELGAGTYYFMACRSWGENVPIDKHKRLMDASVVQQKKKDRL